MNLREKTDLNGLGLPRKAPLSRWHVGWYLERQLRKPAFLSHEVFCTQLPHITLRQHKVLPGYLKLLFYILDWMKNLLEKDSVYVDLFFFFLRWGAGFFVTN